MNAKSITRIVAIIILVVTMTTLIATTVAATNYRYSLYQNECFSFTVTTGKKSGKINFEQAKGVFMYSGDMSGSKYDMKIYGAYVIKVTDSHRWTKEYYWKYKKNFTLNLDKNETYTVTITPYKTATVAKQECSKNLIFKARTFWQTLGGGNVRTAYWQKEPIFVVKDNSKAVISDVNIWRK